MSLGSVLDELKLSDAQFAKDCGLHRTQVWAYRVGRYTPDSANAVKIIGALKKRGVEMDLAALLAPSKRRKRASRRNRAA